MAADLLGAALDDVSWREIAEHYLGDADDEDGAP
jgi:ADP-ribosylglycohydrolase